MKDIINSIRYRDQYHISRKRWLFAVYTISFSIVAVLVFGRFLYYEKSLIGGADGLPQVAAFMKYNGKYYRELLNNLLHGQFHLPMWDMSIGLGMDVLQVLSVNPIYILCSIIFYHNIAFGVICFDMLSLYFAGGAFICFFQKRKVNEYALIAGAIVYVFNGYVLCYCIAQNVFLELYILLPLLLLGVRKIEQDGKYGIFILCVCYLGLSSFVNLYTLTVVLGIYMLTQYLVFRKAKSARKFFMYLLKPIIAYLIGMGLAAVLLIPKMYLSLSSGRVGGTELDYKWLYSGEYYAELLVGTLDPREIGIHGFLGIAGIALLSVFLLITIKSQGKRIKALRIYGCLLVVGMIFPVVGYLFNGFSGINHRFLFVADFYMASVLVYMLPYLVQLKNKDKMGVIWLSLAFYAVYAIVVFWKNWRLGYTSVWMLLYLLIIIWKTEKKAHSLNKYYCICILLVMEIGMFSFSVYDPSAGNYIAKFVDIKTANTEVDMKVNSILSEVDDLSVYRAESVSMNATQKSDDSNSGLRGGYYALNGYFSYTNKEIIEMMNQLGISQMGNPFNIYDLDGRTALYTLGGVKYIARYEKGQKTIPWGYDVIAEKQVYRNGEKQVIQLLRNRASLPLMYGYTEAISTEAFEKLDTYQKEQAMMQAIVLKDNTRLPEAELKFDSKVMLDKEEIVKRIKKKLEKYKEKRDGKDYPMEITDDKIVCQDSYVAFSIPLPDDNERSETYLCLKGLRYTPKKRTDYSSYYIDDSVSQYDKRMFEKRERKAGIENKRGSITVKYGKTVKSFEIWGKNSQYDIGKRDIEINLGYHVEASDEIIVTFEGIGEYEFSDIELVAQPIESYKKNYEKRLQCVADYVAIDGNYVRGGVTTDQNRMLCIAIPYSKGWKASVNGKPVELVKANGMYMAVPLEIGYNEVILQYMSFGLKEGTMVSIITLFMLCLFIEARSYRKAEGKI